MVKLVRGAGRALVAAGLLLAGAWAVLVLLEAGSDAGALRRGLAAGMAALTLAAAAAAVLRRRRVSVLLPFAAALGGVALWFAGISPSSDRDWQPDVARAPWAEIEGDLVAVHNVRNFAWRTETDFAERWETRTVDLRRIEGVDLIASYWMGEAIAHIMLSFVFRDAPPLAFSIETRKEAGESYSTLAGFFKRYELVYVAADERDLIGVRTNVRADPPEDVYLYRTDASAGAARRLFLEYVRQMNALRERPAFYNTATTNCTTAALTNARVNGPVSLLSWKVLFSGHVPRLAHELGRLDGRLPFDQLRRLSRINDAARAAGLRSPGFSARIREGLPVPPPRAGRDVTRP
jgi:hypothetical protein